MGAGIVKYLTVVSRVAWIAMTCSLLVQTNAVLSTLPGFAKIFVGVAPGARHNRGFVTTVIAHAEEAVFSSADETSKHTSGLWSRIALISWRCG